MWPERRPHLKHKSLIMFVFPRTKCIVQAASALVVQADPLGADLPQTIVAMITSNMDRAGHPSRVIVRVGSETAKGSGLLMDSVTRQSCRYSLFGDRSRHRDIHRLARNRCSIAEK